MHQAIRRREYRLEFGLSEAEGKRELRKHYQRETKHLPGIPT